MKYARTMGTVNNLIKNQDWILSKKNDVFFLPGGLKNSSHKI